MTVLAITCCENLNLVIRLGLQVLPEMIISIKSYHFLTKLLSLKYQKSVSQIKLQCLSYQLICEAKSEKSIDSVTHSERLINSCTYILPSNQHMPDSGMKSCREYPNNSMILSQKSLCYTASFMISHVNKNIRKICYCNMVVFTPAYY